MCQLGDLFISYFKRLNKVKNTGGTDTVVGCDTICVHSDTPNAIEIIQNLNKAIK